MQCGNVLSNDITLTEAKHSPQEKDLDQQVFVLLIYKSKLSGFVLMPANLNV